MKSRHMFFTLALCLGLGGCAKEEPTDKPASAPPAPTESPAAGEPAKAAEPELPTSVDFEDEAAAAITPDNYEDTLTALEQEADKDQ